MLTEGSISKAVVDFARQPRGTVFWTLLLDSFQLANLKEQDNRLPLPVSIKLAEVSLTDGDGTGGAGARPGGYS